jgi:hypothetical protein
MSIRRWLGVGVLTAGVLLVALPVKAQEAPKVEVSVGYNFLHLDIDPDEGDPEDLANFPVGWYADLAGNLTSTLGIVGQITGNYKSLDLGFGIDADTRIHTFMGGVRAGGGASNVRPFGQVLFGVAHAKFSTDDLVGDFEESSTDPALQLGAGVNVMSGSVGVRLGADYIRVFADDEGSNVFRFAVGIAFGR